MAKKNPQVQLIALSVIQFDTELQFRSRTHLETVQEYAEAYRTEEEVPPEMRLPPVVLYFDGSIYWLADGFHRVMARKRLGEEFVRALVFQGTKLDAIFHAAGANKKHGIPLTREEKQNIVRRVLAYPEWRSLPSRVIAVHCGVSHTTVLNILNSIKETETLSIQVNPAPADDAESNFDAVVVDDDIPGVTAAEPMSRREVAQGIAERIAGKLAESDRSTRSHVSTELGPIHVVTSSRAYFVRDSTNLNEFCMFVGHAWLAARCVDPNLRIVLLGHFSADLDEAIQQARGRGIEFATPESILGKEEV
jgi:hypothetical protein